MEALRQSVSQSVKPGGRSAGEPVTQQTDGRVTAVLHLRGKHRQDVFVMTSFCRRQQGAQNTTPHVFSSCSRHPGRHKHTDNR